MLFAQCLGWWLLTLSLGFNSFASTPSQPSSATPAQNSADELAARALTEAFFKTWAAKDLDGFLRLWSAKSPELEPRRKSMQELFDGSEKIELLGLTIQAVKIEGDKARVLVEAEAHVIEAKTGKEKAGFGKTLRTLALVKEDGVWRVANEQSAFDELALSLATAADEQERARLLAANADLPVKGLLEALLAQSRQLRFGGKMREAETLLMAAQAEAEKSGEQRMLVLTWLNLGEYFVSRDDFDHALEVFQRALALAETLGGKAEIAGALRSVGTIYEARGDYDAALELYQKALPLAEAAGQKRFVAAMYQDAARIQVKRGELQAAIPGFQKSLEAFEALGEKVPVAVALDWLARVSRMQGNYAEALRYTGRQLTIAEELHNLYQIAAALTEIGNIEYFQGEISPAIEHYQRALTLFENVKSESGVAAIMEDLANISRLQGDFDSALAYTQRGLSITRAMNEPPRLAAIYKNLGAIYDAQGNLSKALETYQQALQIEEKIGQKEWLALSLQSIARVHRIQGNFDLALEFLQRSQALNESMGEKYQIALVLAEMGNVYSERGDLTRALESYQRCLTVASALGNKGQIAEMHNGLGEISLLRGDYVGAQNYFARSLALNETVGNADELVRSYLGLGAQSYKQGRPAEALQYLERALPLADKDVSTDLRWSVHHLAGLSRMALGQTAVAAEELAKAVALIETMRSKSSGGEQARHAFLGTRLGPYHSMIELANSQNRPHDALVWAERSKARVLLDVLQSGKVDMRRGLTDAERRQELRLTGEMSSLNVQLTSALQSDKPDRARADDLRARLDKARLNYEAFQNSLYAAHPELKVRRGEAPVIKTEELAALLPDETSALLEYVVMDDKTYLFVVTKPASKPEAEIQVFSLPINGDELAKQAEAFRERLASRDLGFRASAAKLYNLLLKPAEAQLRGRTNLIIVPDGELWELPFQALLAGANRFLIEDAAIAYAPSLTVLREMAKRNRQRAEAGSSTLLALGNPAFGGEAVERTTLLLRDEKLIPLPEAEQEVRALGRLYGVSRSKVYIGPAASEDRVKSEAGSARVLHFATHGMLNNASPMYSHLVLAQGDTNEDGLLEAWELMQMDLKADLAVLSACETARGRASAGEGVIGLTWALFVAGVSSTVVSQWKVESASTRDLMLNFHRQLRAPAAAKANVAKAEALRQAALKVMKSPETSHPFYWAGFVLVGDGR